MRTFFVFFITTLVVLLSGGLESSFAMDSCHAVEQSFSAKDDVVAVKKVRAPVHAAIPCCSSDSVITAEIHDLDGNKTACCIGSECLKSIFAQGFVSSSSSNFQFGRPGPGGLYDSAQVPAFLLVRNSFERPPPGISIPPLYLTYCSYLI
jgi:hypothetical protein